MKSRWTKEEELEFIRGIAEGKSMDELSKVHDRTSTALELRLKKIIYDNISKGKKPEGIAHNLRINKDKVLQYYFAYMDFREKNGKEVKKVNIDTSTKEQHGGHKKHKSKHKKSKSNSKTIDIKHHRGGERVDKIHNKVNELEKQNKLLETIIKNNQMKNQVRKLYKEDKLDKKMRKIIKKMKDDGLL